jgi:two-component sensor histidine kinase
MIIICGRSLPVYCNLHTAVRPATLDMNDMERVSISGPDFRMTDRQTLSMALAIHELATNASNMAHSPR